jgi:hypothetical protein
VNCDVVKEGVNGFFAITEEEWRGKLERFRGNRARSERFGSTARATVDGACSLSPTIPKIAEILQSAAALHRPSLRKPSRVDFKRDLARSAGSSGDAPRQ